MSNKNWKNDKIQFPRLLAEVWANVEISEKDWKDLAESMDLSDIELESLFNRAMKEWERIKEKTCPVRKSQQPYEMTDVEADADTLASAGMGTYEDYGCFEG